MIETINIRDILGGIAPSLLPGDRLPELGDYNTKEGMDALDEAMKVFFNKPPITKNPVPTLEEETYSLACAIAFEVRDLYKEYEKGDLNAAVYHQRMDNMFRWVMDNFNAVYVVGLMRTVLAVFRVQFKPQYLNNWKEFSDRFKDLILSA